MLLPRAGLHSSLGNIGQLSPATSTSTSRPAPGPGCAPHWHMSPAGGGVVAGQDTSLAGDDITRLLGAGTLASPAARASLRLSSRLDLHYREHRPGCTVPSPALATTRTPHADIITYFQFSLRPHSVIGRIMASALTAVTSPSAQCLESIVIACSSALLCQMDPGKYGQDCLNMTMTLIAPLTSPTPIDI